MILIVRVFATKKEVFPADASTCYALYRRYNWHIDKLTERVVKLSKDNPVIYLKHFKRKISRVSGNVGVLHRFEGIKVNLQKRKLLKTLGH